MPGRLHKQLTAKPWKGNTVHEKKHFDVQQGCDFRLADDFERHFGPPPAALTDDELRALSIDEIADRVGYYRAWCRYLEMVPAEALFVRTLKLYNVPPGLTGDLSNLWGDASGLTGRVNQGTSGNVTGLSGPMDNVWGCVSGVWGKISPWLAGPLTAIQGDLTGKRGNCSGVAGDVTRLEGDLSYFEGVVPCWARGTSRFLAGRPEMIGSTLSVRRIPLSRFDLVRPGATLSIGEETALARDDSEPEIDFLAVDEHCAEMALFFAARAEAADAMRDDHSPEAEEWLRSSP